MAKITREHFTKKNCDPEELYKLYLNLPHKKRSHAETARQWNAKVDLDKDKISAAYVSTQSKKHGWQSRLYHDLGEQGVAGFAGVQKLRIKTMWEDIEADMQHLSSEFMKSIEGKMLAKVKYELDSIKLDSTEKLDAMLDIIMKLTEVEHRIRGLNIDKSDNKPPEAPSKPIPDWDKIINAAPVKPN